MRTPFHPCGPPENNLEASIAMKENLMVSVRLFPISKTTKEIDMKFATVALAIAFAFPSTFALARGGMGRGMGMGSHFSRSFAGTGTPGRIANRPRNISGNTLGPIAHDPSGSTINGAAMNRGG
jgi:hypothetical protein